MVPDTQGRLKGHERDDRGFTLIELLVVVIIVGVLAAIAIPVYLNQQDKARLASFKQTMRTAALALETHAVDQPNATRFGADHNAFATLLRNGGMPSTRISASWAPGANGWLQVYGAPATGYCVTAGTDHGHYYYYDSLGGGLVGTDNEDAYWNGSGACTETFLTDNMADWRQVYLLGN